MCRLIVPALFLALLLPASARAEGRATVALLTELSGPLLMNGAECRQGYEVAEEQIKSKFPADAIPRIVYGDTQGDAKSAVAELRRLIDVEKIAGAVSNRSQVVMAMNAVSRGEKLPLIGMIGHSHFLQKNPYGFRAFQSAQAETRLLAETALRLGRKKVAVIALEDEFTISLAENFKRQFRELGGEIVYDESLLATEHDFSSYISRLKQLKFDAIYLDLLIQSGPFLKRLWEQNLHTAVLGNFWIQRKEVSETAGAAVEGAIFVETALDVPNFQAALTRRFGPVKSAIMTQYICYTGGSLLLEAAAAEPLLTRASLLQSLLRMKTLPTLDGELIIREREIQFHLQAKIMRSGKAEPL